MKKFLDIIIIGFALFSMFFGAGNLVFPPYLGLLSGSDWLQGFVGFIIADIGLALITILTAAKYNGSINHITTKAGNVLGIIISTTIITCLGPLLAIPRTAATTFEVGIQPLLPGSSGIIASVIFFLITMLLTIKPSKVIDIIGQILTPLLLIALSILIIKGIMTPIGDIVTIKSSSNVFSNGISQGYQTMDALAAIAFAFIVISSVSSKGYNTMKEKINITFMSGIVAAIGLILVYGGLTYIGATTSTLYGADISQTQLIVNITEQVLGFKGKVVLGTIVALACLTTSIGLVSAAASFYEKLFNNKISYSVIVVIICVFSAIVSNFGVSTIISFSAPILGLVYPVTIVLVIVSFLDKYITNKNSIKGAVYFTLITSVLTMLNDYGMAIPYVSYLPLATLGFNWILPALIGGLFGYFINPKKIFAFSSLK